MDRTKKEIWEFTIQEPNYAIRWHETQNRPKLGNWQQNFTLHTEPRFWHIQEDLKWMVKELEKHTLYRRNPRLVTPMYYIGAKVRFNKSNIFEEGKNYLIPVMLYNPGIKTQLDLRTPSGVFHFHFTLSEKIFHAPFEYTLSAHVESTKEITLADGEKAFTSVVDKSILSVPPRCVIHEKYQKNLLVVDDKMKVALILTIDFILDEHNHPILYYIDRVWALTAIAVFPLEAIKNIKKTSKEK
jgi:hypothetical protein